MRTEIASKIKMVSINFAKWIACEFWILSSNDLWYQKSDGNPDEGLATEEIYELFLKSFHCQSEIEDNGKCNNQCEHCKEYYNNIEHKQNEQI